MAFMIAKSNTNDKISNGNKKFVNKLWPSESA
jgi:hypothetical protein